MYISHRHNVKILTTIRLQKFYSLKKSPQINIACTGGGGGGGSLPLEAVPDAREKNAEGGYPNQGWARKARTAKRVSKSRKTGKWYPNCYDQSLAIRLYVK